MKLEISLLSKINQTEKDKYHILSYMHNLDLPFIKNKTKQNKWLAPVARACNPSYSGGRDQEDRSLKPVWENSSRDPISKNPITKGLVEWLKV
jgi:hypothetical protein